MNLRGEDEGTTEARRHREERKPRNTLRRPPGYGGHGTNHTKRNRSFERLSRTEHDQLLLVNHGDTEALRRWRASKTAGKWALSSGSVPLCLCGSLGAARLSGVKPDTQASLCLRVSVVQNRPYSPRFTIAGSAPIVPLSSSRYAGDEARSRSRRATSSRSAMPSRPASRA